MYNKDTYISDQVQSHQLELLRSKISTLSNEIMELRLKVEGISYQMKNLERSDDTFSFYAWMIVSFCYVIQVFLYIACLKAKG